MSHWYIRVTYGLIPQIGKTSVADDAAQTEPGGHRRPFGGHGPSRGHLQPKWAKHVGMGRGYGYGASMGAWVLDYASAFMGEWGQLVNAKTQYRNPAFTGDATFLNGEVTDKKIDAEGRGIVTVEIVLTNQEDAVMAKGVVEMELPRD